MAQRCLLLCISSSLIGALAEDGAGFTASLDLRATLHLPRDVPRTAALARGAVEASVLDALRLNVDEITARWRSAAAAPPTAATIARTIERGVAAQQTGTTRGIADAVALYRDVLAREPEHADALHLLGLAVHAQGDGGEAPAALLRRAIAAAPLVTMYRANLGELLIECGDLAAAAEVFAATLELMDVAAVARGWLAPSEAQVLWQLTSVLGDLKRSVRVVEVYTRWGELFLVQPPTDEPRRRKRRPVLLGRTAAALFELAESNAADGGRTCTWARPRRGGGETSDTDQQQRASSCANGAVELLRRAVREYPIDVPLSLRFQLAATLSKLSERGDAAAAALSADAVAVFDDAVVLRQRDAWRARGQFVERVPRPAGVGLREGAGASGGGDGDGEGRPVVAIYCNEYNQSWWGQWGPSSVERGGLGGSEESVVFLSRALVKLGAWVEVYADPPHNETGLQPDGVVWYPWAALPPDLDALANVVGGSAGDDSPPRRYFADAVVSWRYGISAVLSAGKGPSGGSSRLPLALRSYVWLQDTGAGISSILRPALARDRLDAIFTLSEFHAAQLHAESRPLVVIARNALHPKFFEYAPLSSLESPTPSLRSTRRPRRSFMYASAPNRGLEVVLRSWGEIRRRIAAQDAEAGAELHGSEDAVTLTVYYGFSPAFVKWGKTAMANFESWLNEMKRLLDQPGVIYVGMVDHHRLAEAYAATSFYLYPTSFPETGCVALMKALALGAVPITSRHPRSTLPELTLGWDLGPPPPARWSEPNRIGGAIGNDVEWVASWVERVVAAVHPAEAERIEAHRGKMMAWAQQRYRWSHTARVWLERMSRGGERGGGSANSDLGGGGL